MKKGIRPMHPQAEVPTSAPAMTYDQMLERVRYDGAYPTRERAERTVRVVLAAFGGQLSADERGEVAASLPVEAARVLMAEPPAAEPLTGWGFVKDLATRTGGTPATARWDVGTVLALVAHLAGDDLRDRVLARLPSGYALLFGRAELVQAA
ncbi:DUF2267 domain-containing protein [Streptomyces sp. NBC_01725]|uniref:DUF2267 domain-containing protein n=1 Tax=Streptomyces sp. NBC_01725 TaxID=2975923 RepID=UPI002E2DC032|nr:DUF2267 domain-containing protein [Streptomyces sp. NBC_01725]